MLIMSISCCCLISMSICLVMLINKNIQIVSFVTEFFSVVKLLFFNKKLLDSSSTIHIVSAGINLKSIADNVLLKVKVVQLTRFIKMPAPFHSFHTLCVLVIPSMRNNDYANSANGAII